jgi:hypothetical protein
MISIIAQCMIATFGVAAVWLSQDAREARRRFACLFGLAGQPAWFYAAYSTQQWGVFLLCFLYSFCWLRGLIYHWGQCWREHIAVSWARLVFLLKRG